VKGPPVNRGQAGPNSEGCDVGWLCVAKRVPGRVDRKVYPAPDFVAGVVWVDQAAPAPHHIPDYHGRMVRSAFGNSPGRSHRCQVIGVHHGESWSAC
jgi:hypothetical protein